MVYPISKLWAYPVFGILIRKINGLENIPNNTPLIIVSNHEKLIDPLYLVYIIIKKIDKKVHFLSTGKWWFLGETICRKWAGCVPVFEINGAYHEMKNILQQGKIIGIFPEGRLDKKARKLKTGAVRLAIETNAPILPVGIKSSYLPYSSEIYIGKPIYLKDNKNIKKQALDLMKHVYKLRNNLV